MQEVVFTDEFGLETVFYVLEQTKINGVNYLLATDSDEEEEAEAYIFKEIDGSDEEETVLCLVDDEEEMVAISKVFAELMEDIEIEM